MEGLVPQLNLAWLTSSRFCSLWMHLGHWLTSSHVIWMHLDQWLTSSHFLSSWMHLGHIGLLRPMLWIHLGPNIVKQYFGLLRPMLWIHLDQMTYFVPCPSFLYGFIWVMLDICSCSGNSPLMQSGTKTPVRQPISPLGVTSSHVMDAFGPVSRDKLTSSHVMDAFRTTIAGKSCWNGLLSLLLPMLWIHLGPSPEEMSLLRPMLWIYLGCGALTYFVPCCGFIWAHPKRDELTSSHVMDSFRKITCIGVLRPMLWMHLSPSQREEPTSSHVMDSFSPERLPLAYFFPYYGCIWAPINTEALVGA